METMTCKLCGEFVWGKLYFRAGGSPRSFSLHVDCVCNRLGFLEEANKNRRSASLIFGEDLAKSNLRGEVISFLQSLFKEIMEKMCSHTSTSNEAMPEVVVFADGDKDYTASLVVYDRPTDMALECIVCKESLSNDLVYTSDVKPDFRFHAKCALEFSLTMCSHSRSPSPPSHSRIPCPPSSSLNQKRSAEYDEGHLLSVLSPLRRPFDPSSMLAPDKRHPSSSHPPPVKRHPSSSPWAKFLALCCVKNSGKKRSTATLPPEK